MGVIDQLARLFGKKPGNAGQTSQNGQSGGGTHPARASGPALDRKPVNIDVYLEDDDERDLADGLIASAPAPTPPGDDPIEVSLEAEAGETDGSSRAPIISPRNRQELIKELQKNYTEVLGLVREQAAEGRAVVLSSHIMGEVEKVVDRVGMVRKGSVIAEGTLAEVIALAGTRDLDDAFVALLGEDA